MSDAALARLNALSAANAESLLLDCCGSRAWSRAVAAARPFASVESAHTTADEACQSLERGDWLEAFARHPRIGERHAVSAQSDVAKQWSALEQSGARVAPAAAAFALADVNREYERRFGHTYIVCATGRSAEEILALARERLDHDPDTELAVAAAEQRRIMHLRLDRMLA